MLASPTSSPTSLFPNQHQSSSRTPATSPPHLMHTRPSPSDVSMKSASRNAKQSQPSFFDVIGTGDSNNNHTAGQSSFLAACDRSGSSSAFSSAPTSGYMSFNSVTQPSATITYDEKSQSNPQLQTSLDSIDEHMSEEVPPTTSILDSSLLQPDHSATPMDLDVNVTASPQPMSRVEQKKAPQPAQHVDSNFHHNSAPPLTVDTNTRYTRRSNTNPPGSAVNESSPLSAFSHQEASRLIEHQATSNMRTVLLLDMRTFGHYATSRIHGALHLCVPSTLLKRGSFSIDRIKDTFCDDTDRKLFEQWQSYEYILFYDHDSDVVSDVSPIAHIARKFMNERKTTKLGWLKGGYSFFSRKHASLCDTARVHQKSKSTDSKVVRPGDLAARQQHHLASSPKTRSSSTGPANPFFDNIRQNMDLIGGVGEVIPIRYPANASNEILPPFLRDIMADPAGDRQVAERFYTVEKMEQKRMQDLMNAHAKDPNSDHPFSIGAAVEQGQKNRYRNIWPFDHTRVKVGDALDDESACDYVNASFISPSLTPNKKYIATQGPLPCTYSDFWQLVWEQNSRVVVMLTKEKEAGMIKCHRYWDNGVYGDLALELIDYKTEVGEMNRTPESAIGRTNDVLGSDTTGFNFADTSKSSSSGPSLVMRTFKLSGGSETRTITHLHFVGWPDFGVPDSAEYLLDLINLANKAQASVPSAGPLVVHCSAGVGRTGAYIAVDSVLEALKTNNGSTDLVAETVSELRQQRMSMVQSLRQFVFCYECVIAGLNL